MKECSDFGWMPIVAFIVLMGWMAWLKRAR
jgi:hypothetical protein